MRVSGRGVLGEGQRGDLYLNVEVTPHATFQREGDDLRVDVPVDLYTAILGGEVQVPTMERPVALTIPAETPNGKTFRLRGLGMPNLRNPDERGDLYARVNVQLPVALSEAELDLFRRSARSEPGPITMNWTRTGSCPLDAVRIGILDLNEHEVGGGSRDCGHGIEENS